MKKIVTNKTEARGHNRLRELRKEKQISAAAIAEAMDIEVQTYYNLEKGLRRLHEDQLRIAARIFGVSCDEILGMDTRPAMQRNLSYLTASDPGTALNTALKIAQEENWTHDDLRDAIRTMADKFGFFPGGATRPGTAIAS